jgi:hypothetical protein
MKDIQKIKEFFSKPMEAITTAYEAKGEYFKPSIRKDKSNPNFLYVDIAYPEGSDVLSVGGDKTMGGQDRESGAAKALSMGNNIVKKLQSKYNIEDIEVKDLKNGKVEVFAVSDDFIKMASPSLDEAKEETAVDMAKKQLDALGVKYELGNKFKPFKTIYKPTGKSDKFYDTFNDIVDLFNLGNAVKSSMNEANGFKSGKEFINIKLQKYPKAIAKINQLISMVGESNFTMEMAEWIFDFFNNASYESPVNEAKEEDKVDTITMDVPLFLRMLEYSREDAEQDLDLHDVTEKANVLGKERGILSMDDYAEIVGAAEEINEVNLKQSKLSSAEYQKAKKLKDFKASDWKWNADEDLYTKVVKEGMGNEVGDKVYFRGDLGEKYPSSQGYYGIIEDTTPARNYNMMATYEVVVYDKNDNEIRTIKTDFTNLTNKKVNEGELTEEADQKQANNYAYQFMQYFDKMRRIVGGNFGDDTRKEFEKLVQSKFSKHTVNETEELAEAFVPSNIKEFAKRKGVSSLVNKVAGWAEKVGKGIRGGTAIGMNYSTLVLDITYQGSEIRINTNNDTVTLYDEPVRSFDEFKQVYLDNQDESDNGLEERINEALNKINEELCPAGKAYIKRRQAAGEKSSAYLSGRGVKVCKGQMSGKAKKKK